MKYLASTVDVTYVDHSIHLRSPQLKLPLPGRHGGEGHHNQEWPVQLVSVEETVKEGYCLDGLPQTHLISKYHRVIPEKHNGRITVQS